MIYRGDIYYVNTSENAIGSEQKGKRPAIIVSNNTGNKYAPVVEVVYLTGMKKKDLPTHVEIRSCRIPSIALCEQIDTVSKTRLSVTEQWEVNRALAVGIGLGEVLYG